MKLLGYHLTQDYPEIPVQKKTIINTINPHSYCVAKRDSAFREALLHSNFLLPDGVGIVMAAKVLNGKKIEKIAGYDVFIHLLNQLNDHNGSCFFLGASEDTLSKISARLEVEYPNIKIGSYSPPYKPEFSREDSEKMIKAVNTFQPDVLFVGMTAPKQEKWVHQYKAHLNANIICSIGAVFDFYAGTVKRPSQFWIKLGLEWFPRFLKEPRRLAERNLVSTPKFIWEVMRERLKSEA
ncbi:WecB/TagA/CpsF family glycosyltransferase [Salegentibacter sp. JZCK2]|uniref:WecB/TagA/CpsF family glycosyltransferase n=1 Tax=Salegentibacter tibetensis TaxID=2873600 RepID=UPI001CCB7F85|nr:WecB/TagA/CpsF family glycosyltransferase [Salegentibacter tibetensis]MBZ9728697.1 WecB/TagA/CpsF family glycosyltransferase [Salegentibacter tibetensis]